MVLFWGSLVITRHEGIRLQFGSEQTRIGTHSFTGSALLALLAHSTSLIRSQAHKKKKSEKYWGQRQNGWAGAVMVGRGGNGGQGQVIVGRFH